MASYYGDTSFWVALIDRRDAYHAQAIELSRNISGKIVTAQAVLLETANTFARPDWREKAIALINHIVARDDIEVVPFSDAIWERSWKLFMARPDKAWSLTDCISFDVMQSQRITEALTSDAHFRQAGFHTLLI
jgi:predicted nucleic acid-binding protein